MPVTLPTLTETLDNAFTTTWYEIQAEAVDNVLNATPVWALLNNSGAMKTQTGGDLITRIISYAYDQAVAVAKGDQLPTGEVETETMAIWTWRTIAGKVQRDVFDDQKNRGPSKIKDYVGQRLTATRDGLSQKFESSTLNAVDTAETSKEIQSLHDIIPPIASRTTGTYGRINRPTAFADSGNGVFKPSTGNIFWGGNYLAGTLASVEDDLIDDMKKLYNSTANNQVPPNLILTTQALYEIYETFALDAVQIVKDDATMLADLGFEVLRFKGKPMVYLPNMTANHMLMLDMGSVEFVHDPEYWFAMSEWKPEPLTTKRIAHILNFGNMICAQPRRNGRLEYA